MNYTISLGRWIQGRPVVEAVRALAAWRGRVLCVQGACTRGASWIGDGCGPCCDRHD